ncbi:hypothetical protein F5883DRAFT_619196 [Diaporthe sp. PMI_573]|nr:hypothetical protein F5883DRAFT_619196 [Diaporthaceae sp. PMI_573]
MLALKDPRLRSKTVKAVWQTCSIEWDGSLDSKAWQMFKKTVMPHIRCLTINFTLTYETWFEEDSEIRQTLAWMWNRGKPGNRARYLWCLEELHLVGLKYPDSFGFADWGWIRRRQQYRTNTRTHVHEPETNLLVSQRELAVAFLNQPDKAIRALGRWAARGAAQPARAPEQFALLAPAHDIVIDHLLIQTSSPDSATNTHLDPLAVTAPAANMQFLTTALSILSLSGAALGCTRYTVNFQSAEAATVADQAKFNSACNDIKTTIADFSAGNENIYGSDFTNRFTGCDASKCYCSVTAWRYHEWQTTENKYELGAWEIKNDWTPIDSKTVHC